MSITFWAPSAPTVTVREECIACDGEGCGYCDDKGFDMVKKSTLPELNMSNTNAWDFLKHMGLTPDHCGTIPHSALADLEIRLTLMANGITSVFLEKETVTEGRVSFGGRDHEYVVGRSKEMLDLVRQAKAHNYSITWG